MQRRMWRLMALVVLAGGVPVGVAAAPNGDGLVAVAWDGTQESGCEAWVQEGDGPQREIPCAPGSVIFVEKLTVAKANERRLSYYATLTGDKAKDAKLLKDLADKKHREVAAARGGGAVRAMPSTLPMADRCQAAEVTVGGSYNNPRADARTSYKITYDRSSTCYVSGVIDWAKYGNGSDRVYWVESCTQRNGYDCRGRGLWRLRSDWRGPYPLGPSHVGNYYRNYSECQGGCGISNYVLAWGYRDFV